MFEDIKKLLDALPLPAFLWDCVDGGVIQINAAAGNIKELAAEADSLTLRPTRSLHTIFASDEKFVRPTVNVPVVLQDKSGLFLPLEGWMYYPYDNIEDLGIGATAMIFVAGDELAPEVKHALREINLSREADPRHAASNEMSDPDYLKQIIDAFPGMVFIKDINGKYVTCSEAFADFVNLKSPADIVGKNTHEVLPPTSSDWAVKLDRLLFETQQPNSEIYPFSFENNAYTNWQRVSRKPLRGGNGELIGLVGTLEDVGGIVTLTEELTMAKARFMALSELMTYSSFILILWDMETLNTDYVSSNISYLGIKPGKLSHMNDWASCVHPDDVDEFWNKRTCLLGRDPSVDFWHEYRVINASGEVRWVNERISPVSAPGARLYRSMFIDTTARHEHENITAHAASGGSPLSGNVHMLDIVSREYLQQLCNTVSGALGCSSLIIDPAGTPLTESSGSCELCTLIRSSERGATLCHLSDVNISIAARDAGSMIIAPCETIGLYTAAAPIIVGGRHMATWMIGRERSGHTVDEENIRALSRRISIDEQTAIDCFNAMPERDNNEITQIFSLLTPYVQDLSEFINRSFLMMQETERLVKSQEFIAKNVEMESLQGHLYETFFDVRQSGDISRFQNALNEICDFFGFNRASVIRMQGKRPELVYRWMPSILDSYASTVTIEEEFEVFRKHCGDESGVSCINRTALPDEWQTELGKLDMENCYVYPVENRGRCIATVCFSQGEGRPLLNDEEFSYLNHLMRTVGSYLIMKQLERRMQENTESLHLILNNLQENIYVIDRNTYEVIFANKNFDGQTITGSRGVACFRLLGLERPCACCGLDMLRDSPEGYSYTFETNERNPGFWHSITMTSMSWLDERPVFLINIRDITEEKLRQEQYLNAATFDISLGIPNLGRLTSRLGTLVSTNGAQGYLLIVDIDNIKMIINAYGHDYGDALLREITAFFKSALPDGDFVYRYASTTLAVLCENADKLQMDHLVKTMYNRFSLSWRILDKRCFSTFSAAMVGYRHGAAMKILRDADFALENSIYRGRNTFYELTESVNVNSEELLELANDLHQMVGDGCRDLIVYYQPVYDIEKKKITHFEALMRWKHPTHGIIPPLKFIKLSEQTALIGMLSEKLISAAVSQCKAWQSILPGVKASVNFSATHSRQSDTLNMVSNILKENDFKATDLVVEISEDETVADQSNIFSLMRDLQSMGCTVALDNFGAGMSSLGKLENMPINLIKVDRSFVSNICENQYDRNIIEFMNKLGGTLGYKIVCQGVETLDQFNLLRSMGVNYVQGYLLSKPLPAIEIDELLTKQQELNNLLGCIN